MNALKDGMPAEGIYSIEAVRVLDTHRTPIQKQPEMLLCLVGISRRYYLGDELYPTFLHDDDRDMDLFDLIRAPNPTKVKTGSRPRTPHKVPLLTLTAPHVIEMDELAATDSSGVPFTIERSPLDFAHEAEASDQGTAVPEMPSSKDVPATAAPGQARLKRLDHADPRPSRSSHGGKSLAAIQLGLASTVVVLEDAPVGISDLDPLSFANAPSRHPVDVAQSFLGIAVAGDLESENASSPAEVGSPGSVYQPKWDVTNGSLLDTPKACQDLVDHAAPPGYFFELRHMRNEEFLGQYNVARRDKRIQARKLEIKNLEALLETEADMKRAAEDKSARLTKELEDMRARFSDLQVSNEHLSQQVATLKEQAFADVVSARITKGMSEGPRHGVEHGQAQLDVESIAAYDPKAEAKFVTALQALKDLKYLLLDQLEGLKDAPIDVIMASLYPKSDTGEDAPQYIRDLHPSSSQLTIPVYLEVRDPRNLWAYKEEMKLADAIAANISRAEKKKCCIGLALLLADAATQTEFDDT
nr:transposase (putative), gypsy type [Tanacetum cinerariifolium]